MAKSGLSMLPVSVVAADPGGADLIGAGVAATGAGILIVVELRP